MHPGRVVTTFVALDGFCETLVGVGVGQVVNYDNPTKVRLGSNLIKVGLVPLLCEFERLSFDPLFSLGFLDSSSFFVRCFYWSGYQIPSECEKGGYSWQVRQKDPIVTIYLK